MKFGKLVIDRPKGFILIFIVILIAGIYAMINIPKEDLPDVAYPKLTVQTTWRGQSPENMVKYVTSVIEENLNSIRGIKKITSDSYKGFTRITLELERDVDVDFQMFLVNEKLSSIRDKLPPKLGDIEVNNFVPQDIDETTFFSLYLFSNSKDKYNLSKFAEEKLKRELAQIQGVSEISVRGGVQKELKIEYESDIIEKYNINFNNFFMKLINSNEKISLGKVNVANKRLYMTFTNKIDLNNVENFKIQDGINAGNVADIYFQDSEPRTIHRVNGGPAVYVVLAKAKNANAIIVSNKVKNKLKKIKSRNPDINYKIQDNEGKKVLEGYRDILLRIVISIVAIFLVLFSFMRHIKPSLITMGSIFLSVSFSINFLFFSGESLNTFTISGIALAFGLLVDNAVVVYENIHKHFYSGKSIKESIMLSFREMFIPIIASTFTTVCVVIPFIFLQEELKIYYIPFAKTVVVSLIASVFISFSLIPIAFSYLHIEEKIQKSKNKIIELYKRYIANILKYRYFALVVLVFILGFSILKFVKDVDKSSFSWGGRDYNPYVTCYFRSKPNVPKFRLENAVKQFEGLIEGNQIVDYYRTSVSDTEARVLVYFKDEYEGSAGAYSLREKLKIYGNRMSQVYVTVYGIGPSFGGGFSGSVRYSSQIYLQGYNYEKLKTFARRFETTLLNFREISDVKLGVVRKDSTQIVNVKLQADKLDAFDLDISEIQQKVSYLIREGVYEDIIKYDNDYINLAFEAKNKINLFELKNLYIKEGIKLSDISEITLEGSTRSIERENQVYNYPISYEYSGGYQDREEFEESLANNLNYPPGFSLKTEDKNRWWWDEEQDYQRILVLLGFAILLIYMVISALYESYSEPFIILITLPLAFVGVIWLYYLFNLTFGVHAIMGSMLLAGIVVNNAIIMINHINHLRREKNHTKVEGIIIGAADRFRPILITSFTTIMGLLPIIIFSTEKARGSEEKIWKHLSYATVGGLTTATIFTLTFMPLLYYFFAKKREKDKPYQDSGVWKFLKSIEWKKLPSRLLYLIKNISWKQILKKSPAALKRIVVKVFNKIFRRR
ncbi:MAG: efflux RND transporter permease subunit [Candidatus Mcinerneyibacterium aminivorans]|uniref:Efflux RND transporter permease subunit n=1 Tax=Candidatus Mcinerneyibacterium aminivorans TaxID=2703815 RepID=A0A5D0M9M2_9BACT|nr:MAG: efflux RND transporter permease subunit [Candidatus Mcinerneyibacterium aminivorans]